MRILYIEDKDTFVDMLERIATHMGHELLVAVNGAQGLELLSQKPTLIITDLGLPDMDGFELIPRIRALCPDVPLIAFTGKTLDGEREQCLAAGCAEYIPKPMSVPELMALFQRYTV